MLIQPPLEEQGALNKSCSRREWIQELDYQLSSTPNKSGVVAEFQTDSELQTFF